MRISDKQLISRTNKSMAVVIVAVLINFALAFLKLFIGLDTGSLCIILDATNSFLDVATGMVTIIAFIFVLSGSDDNGIGYGRIEYLASFVAASLVVAFGIVFLIKAVERFITPVPVGWSWLQFGLLFICVFGKVVLFLMFYFANKKMHSKIFKTLAVDAILDMSVTIMSILSIVVSRYGSIMVDAIFGMVISICIIIIGFGMIFDNVKILIGVSHKELISDLRQEILNNDNIVNVGQVKIEDYGYENVHATVQVQINENLTYDDMLKMLEEIKDDVFEKFNLYLELSIVREVEDKYKKSKWINGKKVE